MNTRLIALLAGICMSATAMAQTQSSGTSSTGKPTTGQSTATSGEQNANAMQNNSNMQNTAPPKPARHTKKNKGSKTTDTSCTDGNAAVAATSEGKANRNCDKTATGKP